MPFILIQVKILNMKIDTACTAGINLSNILKANLKTMSISFQVKSIQHFYSDLNN